MTTLRVLIPQDSHASDGRYQLSSDQVNTVISSLPSAQSKVIKDGLITWDDYQASFGKYTSCLQSAGAVIEGQPTVNARRKLTVQIAVPLFGNGPAHADGIIQDCYRQNLSLIDQLWSMQNAPSQAELEDARIAFAACLRDQGFSEVPARPKPGELVKFWPSESSSIPGTTFFACQAKVDQAFGLEGFGG